MKNIESTSLSVTLCVYRSALIKLNECRRKCPGVGGDIDAANLSWLIENEQTSESSALQASKTLHHLSIALGVDAKHEVEALKCVEL